MLVLENVNKIYYSSKHIFKKASALHAVKNLSLEIEPGAFGLLGVNGAGKTTTIKMLSTLLLPTSGRIFLDGTDILKNARNVRIRINMITGGERMLYYRLTGMENLLYFASLYNLLPRQAKARAEKLMELVGLSNEKDRRVEQYSKGMKQRLCIARGLINNPEYLYLDEPTLGLDVAVARELRQFVKETLVKKEGKTVILTSHYMDEVEEICPRLGILKAGQLIYLGTTGNLLQKLGLSMIHQFKIKQGLPGGLEELQRRSKFPMIYHPSEDGSLVFSIRTDEEVANHIFAILSEQGVYRVSYQTERPSLEDALLKLTQEECHEYA